MTAWWTVLAKELVDAFRDRRMVVVAMVVMPLAVPLVLAGMSALGSKRNTVSVIRDTIIEAIEENEIASLPLAMTRGVEIYPNPAKGVIYIRVPLTFFLSHQRGEDRMEIKIFDVSGKMVKEIATSATQTRNDMVVKISLKGINPGIYFLRLGKETKKFLVVK